MKKVFLSVRDHVCFIKSATNDFALSSKCERFSVADVRKAQPWSRPGLTHRTIMRHEFELFLVQGRGARINVKRAPVKPSNRRNVLPVVQKQSRMNEYLRMKMAPGFLKGSACSFLRCHSQEDWFGMWNIHVSHRSLSSVPLRVRPWSRLGAPPLPESSIRSMEHTILSSRSRCGNSKFTALCFWPMSTETNQTYDTIGPDESRKTRSFLPNVIQ